MPIPNKRALIMVDVQNDFCPGGRLAVPRGDEIVPLANQLQIHFDLVIASLDWHPQDHVSFASNHPGHAQGEVMMVNGVAQILWPDHCVQNTHGAEFHPHLDTSRVAKIVYKGVDSLIDSYSAFYDNAHLRGTGLIDYLREQGVSHLYVLGLATEYCVKYTCLDAVGLGLKTHLIMDACRGIEMHKGDIDTACADMQQQGVVLMRANEV